MRRRVKDFIEVKDQASLDALIVQLQEIRDSLPEGAEAEVRMRGDDVFGRQLSIAYSREQTVEEAECDARYAEAYRESREQPRFYDEIGVCQVPRGKLRAVA